MIGGDRLEVAVERVEGVGHEKEGMTSQASALPRDRRWRASERPRELAMGRSGDEPLRDRLLELRPLEVIRRGECRTRVRSTARTATTPREHACSCAVAPGVREPVPRLGPTMLDTVRPRAMGRHKAGTESFDGGTRVEHALISTRGARHGGAE
jgi:hypothetical protein